MDWQSHRSKQSYQIIVLRVLHHSTADAEEEEKCTETACEVPVTSTLLLFAVLVKHSVFHEVIGKLTLPNLVMKYSVLGLKTCCPVFPYWSHMAPQH